MAGSELDGLVLVAVLLSAALTYTRLVAAGFRPGLPRLLAVLPAFAAFTAVPLFFSTFHMRIGSFYCLVIAGAKLVLFATGAGPLSPSLPLHHFILLTILPFRITNSVAARDSCNAGNPAADVCRAVASKILGGAVMAAVYRSDVGGAMPRLFPLIHFLYLYCLLGVALDVSGAVAAAIVPIGLHRSFNKFPVTPLSINDFWGGCWNLVVSDAVRTVIYAPLRKRFGRAAAVLVSFLVSGAFHELLYFYLSHRPPTGEFVSFFLLNGLFVLGEEAVRDVRRKPTMFARVVFVWFFFVSGSVLFFGPLVRAGVDKQIIGEYLAFVGMVESAAGKAVAGVGSLAEVIVRASRP